MTLWCSEYSPNTRRQKRIGMRLIRHRVIIGGETKTAPAQIVHLKILRCARMIAAKRRGFHVVAMLKRWHVSRRSASPDCPRQPAAGASPLCRGRGGSARGPVDLWAQLRRGPVPDRAGASRAGPDRRSGRVDGASHHPPASISRSLVRAGQPADAAGPLCRRRTKLCPGAGAGAGAGRDLDGAGLCIAGTGPRR